MCVSLGPFGCECAAPGSGGGGGLPGGNDDVPDSTRRGVGGAVGGYAGATFVAMCIVLAVLFKRHQDNLTKWRAAKATGGGAAATQEGGLSLFRMEMAEALAANTLVYTNSPRTLQFCFRNMCCCMRLLRFVTGTSLISVIALWHPAPITTHFIIRLYDHFGLCSLRVPLEALQAARLEEAGQVSVDHPFCDKWVGPATWQARVVMQGPWGAVVLPPVRGAVGCKPAPVFKVPKGARAMVWCTCAFGACSDGPGHPGVDLPRCRRGGACVDDGALHQVLPQRVLPGWLLRKLYVWHAQRHEP